MHITINLRSASLALLLPLIFTPQSGLLAQVTAPNQCVPTPDFPAGSACRPEMSRSPYLQKISIAVLAYSAKNLNR